MLERLVEYVLEQPENFCAQLLLQDMALCQAWLESCDGDGEEAGRVKALRDRVVCWQQAEPAAVESTAGRRQQMFLREAVSRIQRKGLDALSNSEVFFLHAVDRLLTQVVNPERFARVERLLRRSRDRLIQRCEGIRPTPHLPDLSGLIQYVTEADILQAPVRDTRLLAGIELPCRGPVLSASCHLRVLGDVPERSTVVVEGAGHCCVDGYVMGRVLSKRQCEIRGNISGVAVVLHGDIRARSIINNAQVIAKMGSVYCQSAQGPKLVFAGRRLSIAGDTMLGNYIARKMDVGNDVRGGRIQVSELVQAKHFRHLGANTLSVVLRRELNCEDFGEVTGAELKKLLSRAYRLRSVAHHFEAVGNLAQNEAERSAQSVLMYVFGSGEAHRKLGSLMRCQRRIEILNRIENNLRDLLETARDGLTRRETSTAPDLQSESLALFDDSDPVDDDLRKEHEDAVKLRERLRARGLDRKQRTLIMQQTAAKLEHVEEEKRAALVELERKEKSIQTLEPYEKLVESSGKGASKLEVLQRVLPTLQQQTEGPIASRLKSGFVTMELRKISQRVRYAEDYRKRAEDTLHEFRTVTDRLGEDFQVEVLERPEDESLGARAIGHFDEGVSIYLEVVTEDPSEQPPGTVFKTEVDDGVRCYIRERDHVRFHRRRE